MTEASKTQLRDAFDAREPYRLVPHDAHDDEPSNSFTCVVVRAFSRVRDTPGAIFELGWVLNGNCYKNGRCGFACFGMNG